MALNGNHDLVIGDGGSGKMRGRNEETTNKAA